MKQLLYSMFVNNNDASFQFRWKENLVKLQNVSKYYDHDRSLFVTARNFERAV